MASYDRLNRSKYFNGKAQKESAVLPESAGDPSPLILPQIQGRQQIERTPSGPSFRTSTNDLKSRIQSPGINYCEDIESEDLENRIPECSNSESNHNAKN